MCVLDELCADVQNTIMWPSAKDWSHLLGHLVGHSIFIGINNQAYSIKNKVQM